MSLQIVFLAPLHSNPVFINCVPGSLTSEISLKISSSHDSPCSGTRGSASWGLGTWVSGSEGCCVWVLEAEETFAGHHRLSYSPDLE